MDDMLLWAVALVVGVLGLLLLAVAGAAAVTLNSGTQRARQKTAAQGIGAASANRARAYAAAVPPADRSQPLAGQASASSGIWAWIKATFFAAVHAAAVSFVLGGVTFFEDLVRANEEIRQTGTVTFPKQLLPGTLYDSRKSLSSPADTAAEGEYREDDAAQGPLSDADRSSQSSAETLSWEVVDMMDEVSDEADGWSSSSYAG